MRLISSDGIMVAVERDYPRKGSTLGGRREVCGNAREDDYVGGSPDRMDEGLRQVREHVLPLLQQQDGFKGFIALGDRQSGKLVGVSFWESEQAMQASEGVGDRTRSETAEAISDTIAGVERYEVALFELSS